MEKQPCFVPKLSLKEMAVRKSVGNFWNETDILALIEDFPFQMKVGKAQLWQETVENKVKDKISKFVFPESLKRRMNLVVKPIGLQIPEWGNFIRQCLCDSREILDMHLLKQICWATAGKLNYGKTAEKLVRLQTLDVVKRFKIACGHCLVDSLPAVWKELPEEYKKNYCNGSGEILLNYSRILFLYREKLLQIYWVHVLKGQECKLLEIHANFYLSALTSSAEMGNKAAAEYFFQKLTKEERDMLYSTSPNIFHRLSSWHLSSDFPQDKCNDVSVYLLSQMTVGEQMQVLRDRPGYIFRIFLHWRWHDLFLDNTDLIWKSISDANTYHDLYYHIAVKIQFSECYFPELFQEFFCRSPSDFRKYFVNRECRLDKILFSKFINNEDKETVKAILINIDVEDRVRLVSSFGVFECLDSILGFKDPHLVELCVLEAYPSEEDRERLKEVYMRFLTRGGRCQKPDLKWRKRKWQLFFKSLVKSDASGLKKRSSEDESVTRVKRLH